MSDKVREAFEAWTIGAGGHPSVLRRNASGDYALGSVRAEYAAWQASRLAALEEAASALQKKGDGLTKASGFRSGYMKATYDAADDIRALAQGGGA